MKDRQSAAQQPAAHLLQMSNGEKPSTDAGQTGKDIPGAILTTLSFTAQGTDHGKQYRAVFSNGSGSTTTTTANC
ncbi:MAG: hypothetical protein U0175_15005 [Caldilineaceae bacterium]